MSRMFTVEASPEIARQIMRLHELTPEIGISPEIEELAQQDTIDWDCLPSLTREAQDLVRDLLDFGMRAAIVMPNSWRRHMTTSLEPIFVAARLSGITDIAVGASKAPVWVGRVKEAGFTLHLIKDRILDTEMNIPRSALLILAPDSIMTNDVIPLSMEFEKTIIVGDALSAGSVRLYEDQYRLIETSLMRSEMGMLADKSKRDIAFLFSVSYAMSRIKFTRDSG